MAATDAAENVALDHPGLAALEHLAENAAAAADARTEDEIHVQAAGLVLTQTGEGLEPAVHRHHPQLPVDHDQGVGDGVEQVRDGGVGEGVVEVVVHDWRRQ